MSEILHRLKVFLYRHHGERPEYLLLKPDQGIEALWGPLQSELGFGEKLESAVRVHVRNEAGVELPGQLIDLDLASQWSIGDEHIVEWHFGLHCLGEPDPTALEAHWAAHRWSGFEGAYPSLGLEYDRQAILRLHTRLEAA